MAVLLLPTIYFLLFSTGFHIVSSFTFPQDAAVLRSLKDQWDNIPPSWDKSGDPCGKLWEGVICNNKSRVTALGLSSLNLEGKLAGDIGKLSELVSLDLSFNTGLTGTIPAELGDLNQLSILILAGCGFSGRIPPELGNLSELTFLALNTNNFSDEIPPSLGLLSKLYWLDLSENQLTGSIPVSSLTSPGLDMLKKAKHFHLNKNELSGTISPNLFSSDMVLIHVLFEGNQLRGKIPSTIGLVETLEVLRLDRNLLSNIVPPVLKNLANLSELNLAENNLSGPLPDLTGLNALTYVDLSNNSFTPSEVPDWFSTLPALTTLIIENGSLSGELSPKMFSFSPIQQVRLKNNAINGTLNLGSSISDQLQLVDLQNNQISAFTVGSGYKNTLMLNGNPICSGAALSNTQYCQLQQLNIKPYSTSIAQCGDKSCRSDQKVNPQSCNCAYPYEGTLYFRGPSFSDTSNATRFRSLELSLWTKLGLTPGSVSLQNPFFDQNSYLQIHLDLFPPTGKKFNRSAITKLGFDMSNQTFKPPPEFGPYIFIPSPYGFSDGGNSISKWLIAVIACGCAILVLGLLGLGMYAVRQKKRAERAIGLSKPFASWAPSGKDSGGAPQLKGARWFAYDELKKCTHNFSDNNEIGSGGYGKVYRGMLPSGQVIAIKRAQKGSMQGGLEFKTEIELLSRVHHKNLVGLVGFCFEQGEQMLVYEYMPNGTLRESLSGKSGIHLDWKRRMRIALGSARGLAYLHELANPPIIHRDVKSTNILLDENLTAKVADFGLSKLVSDGGEKGHVSTQVKGTLGYLDPEYYMTQQLTEKSDVYSFGVVMLELITARQPIEKGKYIVREVRLLMDKNDEDKYGLRDLMDHSIKNIPNLIGFGRFLELAMQCVEESAADRPSMSEVVKTIESILQNDGLNTNSTTSASSSANDFGSSKIVPKHPYDDSLPKKDVNNSSGAFEYSGGYTISTKVEPK